MSDRIKYRLNKENSKTSVNTDTSIGINLQQKNRLFPAGDMNRILDVGEQFQKERNNSTKYRFVLSINSLFTNVLTDIDSGSDNGNSNEDTLNYFSSNLFMYQDGDVNGDKLFENINDSINNYLTEVNGWFGYYVPSWDTNNKTSICQFKDLNPKRELFDLTPISNNKNWDIFLTYPSSTDKTHFLVNNGLIIVDDGEAFISGKSLKSLMTPVKHGLTNGDKVRVDNIDYNVIRLGNDKGENQDYIFVIDLPSTSLLVGVNSRMKRLYNGQESEYYFRIFKPITIETDYEIYPLAFSKNLYNDKINQLVFNKDIDVSNYTDNLGRPLSELYLTIIKRNNNGFTNIKSGIEIPYIGNLTNNDFIACADINRIHNVINWGKTSHTPLESNIINTNQSFYGDIVEYNKLTVEEKILSEVRHRFNRINRDSNGRPEGYYYKPHQIIPIRYWSTFVEQGDINTDNLPSYAQDLNNGSYLWRDLLDIGLNDGQPEILDYPFLNGLHYPYTNINFKLRRQDPFNLYGLYYSTSPRDIFGGKSYLDNLIIKKAGDGNC